jgi:hypothetical protein
MQGYDGVYLIDLIQQYIHSPFIHIKVEAEVHSLKLITHHIIIHTN